MNNKKKITTLLLAGAVPFNFLVYQGGRFIARDLPHVDLTSMFDAYIPVLPWTVFIYWGIAVPFWIINHCLCAYYDKYDSQRFIISHYIGHAVCFLVFALFPTTMQRPEIVGSTIFDLLLVLVYQNDSPDNLLPSIHCFSSWLCWIGTRGNPQIPVWYQFASLLIAIAICLSTLTVKQHVIVDVVAGIMLAEFSYYIAGQCGRIRLFHGNIGSSDR